MSRPFRARSISGAVDLSLRSPYSLQPRLSYYGPSALRNRQHILQGKEAKTRRRFSSSKCPNSKRQPFVAYATKGCHVAQRHNVRLWHSGAVKAIGVRAALRVAEIQCAGVRPNRQPTHQIGRSFHDHHLTRRRGQIETRLASLKAGVEQLRWGVSITSRIAGFISRAAKSSLSFVVVTLGCLVAVLPMLGQALTSCIPLTPQ